MHRHTLLASLVGAEEFDAQHLYDTEIAPKAVALHQAGVNVLGFLSPPSAIRMAVTDLHTPFAVFEFLTVEDTPLLNQQIQAAGLTSEILEEGMVNTLGGDTWYSMASK
jgi:hypothetical protein